MSLLKLLIVPLTKVTFLNWILFFLSAVLKDSSLTNVLVNLLSEFQTIATLKYKLFLPHSEFVPLI